MLNRPSVDEIKRRLEVEALMVAGDGPTELMKEALNQSMKHEQSCPLTREGHEPL